MSIALQFVSLFWSDSRFLSLTDKDVAYIQQSMAEDGAPPNQQRHMSAALRGIRFSVSHYVRTVGLQLIMLNAVTLAILFAGERTGFRPRDKA